MSKRAKTQFSRDPKGSAPAQPACVPLKPRRKLFVGLIVGFAIWVGVLLALYFKTVYPMRHSAEPRGETPRGQG